MIWLYDCGADIIVKVTEILFNITEEEFYQRKQYFLDVPQYSGDNFWFLSPLSMCWSIMLNIVCCVAAVQVAQAKAGYQFMGFFCLIFFCWLPVIFNLMMIFYFFLVSLPGAKEHCCHKCSKICRLKDPKDIIDFVSFTSDSENYSKCPLCKEILAFQRSLNNDDWRSYIKLLFILLILQEIMMMLMLKVRLLKFGLV